MEILQADHQFLTDCINDKSLIIAELRHELKFAYDRIDILENARVAQLEERLICNQEVTGSTPVAGSISENHPHDHLPEGSS
jgi:hypothetical protein